MIFAVPIKSFFSPDFSSKELLSSSESEEKDQQLEM